MVLLLGRPARYRCDRRWCGPRGAGMCGVHILAKSLSSNAINVVHAVAKLLQRPEGGGGAPFADARGRRPASGC